MDRAPYYGTFFVQQLPSSLISPWSSRWPRWQYLSLPQNTTKNNPRASSSFHQIDRDNKTNLPNFPFAPLSFLSLPHLCISTPVSAITSKQALRVKFAIEFYKSKITPDFYRLSKCPVRCLIYLCIRKLSIQKQEI